MKIARTLSDASSTTNITEVTKAAASSQVTTLSSTTESTVHTTTVKLTSTSTRTTLTATASTKSISFSATLTCDGSIDTAYECFQCYDGEAEKYLWGRQCKAKKLLSSTMINGRCGMEYACVTNEIGDCPYNDYCPESSPSMLFFSFKS